MGRSALGPRELLAVTERRLAAMADPARAAGARAYFRRYEPVLYGVAVPEVRRLARELFAAVRAAWTVREAISFCDLCMRRRRLETKWIGCFVLGRYADALPLALLATIKSWALAGRCDNWAIVDALAPPLVSPLLRREPAATRTVAAWARSPNQWVRRIAVVALVPLARRGEQLGASYRVAAALFGDREDLIHKACGWLLREAGKTDPARLERFLLAHGPRIPRTTLRYAIERMPPGRRSRLLERTRPGARRPARGETRQRPRS